MSDLVPGLDDRASRADQRLENGHWDRALLDEWVRRLGADRMLGVVVKLREQLRTLSSLLANDASGQRDDLHRRAHDVASTAGMLGFADVTRCCRALIEPGANQRDVRRELSDTLASAIAQIDGHLASDRAKVAA